MGGVPQSLGELVVGCCKEGGAELVELLPDVADDLVEPNALLEENKPEN